MTKKKINGFGDMIGFMVTFLLLIMMLFYSLDMFGMLHKANSKEDIAREYIFRMESSGYLSSTDKDSLESELTALGVYDISFDGTTMTQVPYGSTITLCVTGKVKTSGIIGISKGLSFIKGKEYENFKIYKKSTAKN